LTSKRAQVLFTKKSKKSTFFILYSQEAFDHSEARKNGNIMPARSGIDENYDKAKAALAANAEEREAYLKEQVQYFKARVSAMEIRTVSRNRSTSPLS
jgi:hypothetical protein